MFVGTYRWVLYYAYSSGGIIGARATARVRPYHTRMGLSASHWWWNPIQEKDKLMSDQWLEDYILLALRIDKALREFSDKPFLGEYYGPPELTQRAESKMTTPPVHL